MKPMKAVINFQTAEDESKQANKNKDKVLIGIGHTEPSDINVQKTAGGATQENENMKDIAVGNCESDSKIPDQVKGSSMDRTKAVINFQTAEGSSTQANKNRGKVLIGNGHRAPSDINAQKTAGSATQKNENEQDIQVGNRESDSKIPDRVGGLTRVPDILVVVPDFLQDYIGRKKCNNGMDSSSDKAVKVMNGDQKGAETKLPAPTNGNIEASSNASYTKKVATMYLVCIVAVAFPYLKSLWKKMTP